MQLRKTLQLRMHIICVKNSILQAFTNSLLLILFKSDDFYQLIL